MVKEHSSLCDKFLVIKKDNESDVILHYNNFILNEIDNEQNDFNYNDEVKSEQNLSELLMTKIEKQKSNNKDNDKKNKSITNPELNAIQYVEVNGKIYPNDEIQNKEFYLSGNCL